MGLWWADGIPYHQSLLKQKRREKRTPTTKPRNKRPVGCCVVVEAVVQSWHGPSSRKKGASVARTQGTAVARAKALCSHWLCWCPPPPPTLFYSQASIPHTPGAGHTHTHSLSSPSLSLSQKSHKSQILDTKEGGEVFVVIPFLTPKNCISLSPSQIESTVRFDPSIFSLHFGSISPNLHSLQLPSRFLLLLLLGVLI